MLVKIIDSLHPSIKNDRFVYNVNIYFDIYFVTVKVSQYIWPGD